MTGFSLGSDWVSRVTSAPNDDVSTIGADVLPLPEPAQLQALLREVAATSTAREMVRRKWITPANLNDLVAGRASALYEFLFARPTFRPSYALFRGRRQCETQSLVTKFATLAWVSRVLDTARASTPCVGFDLAHLDEAFTRHLATLSTNDDGPQLAKAALYEIGIKVVIERGLPGMSVDGASLHLAETGPIIALTLRYDRLDNFWFTLMHELGHVALHLGTPRNEIFVDSLEDDTRDDLEIEAEADAYAKDSLVARDIWLRSNARRRADDRSVRELASQLGIHPAIVAGRVRYERRDFQLLSGIVGEGSVRGMLLSDQ